MLNKIFSKLKVVMVVSVFIVALFQYSIETKAAEQQENVIRVGAPIQTGLFMKDEMGKLSGYTYDYLMEMSQYTGWNYEFVYVDAPLNEQITTLMEMLKNGEIDLLGAMNYSESLTESYAYSGYCYGINYYGLFTRKDSEINETSLYNNANLRVGVHSKSGRENSKLQQFAQMNNINVEQVVVDTSQKLFEMLEEGHVDVVLSTDLSMASRKDLNVIAHFSPEPFYFTMTKGNTEMVKQVDGAISTINQVNPNLNLQLYNKYFSKSSNQLALTKEELEFIEKSEPLEVVLYDNKPPFQYQNETTGEAAGIVVELLDQITESTGLTFQYHMVSTYQEYIEAIRNGEADIAADALTNYQDAIDMQTRMTLPWYSLPIVKVFKENSDLEENGTYGIPYFLKNVYEPSDDIIYYDTVEECVRAVQKGMIDYSYVGEFCGQYYLNQFMYDDLRRINQPNMENQKLCFGITNTSDILLLTIMNKAIMNLSEDRVNEIVYLNTYQIQELTFFELLQKNRNFVVVFVLVACLIVFLIYTYLKNKQQKRLTFENERYLAISNLTNEYFYEYNVKKDELTLSEKCAAYFETDARISDFSKKLLALKEEEQCGIWQFGEYIISREEGQYELSCQMLDHKRVWFQIVASNLRGKKNQLHAVGKITNIHTIKTEKIRLEQSASLDGLTGIYNIQTIKEKIKEYLLQPVKDESCAFIILDLDNFKEINDQYGHYSGDMVLVQAAHLITHYFAMDLVGRLGGDEFIVFVQTIKREELEQRCQSLCKSMEEKTKELLGNPYSWSIGITLGKSNKSYEELYQEADQALYEIKMKTKNGYAFFRVE